MSWTYLIQFQEKQVPEKQEIELLFISTPTNNIIEDDDIQVIFQTIGEIRIEIQHTARTWGSDIEALLTNQINSILINKSKITRFFKKHSVRIGLITGTLFLISSLIGIYFAGKKFNSSQLEKIKTFTSQSQIDISKKIDYLLNYIATDDKSYFINVCTLFFFTSLLLAILLGIWVESLANNKQYSFVILTREAVKNSIEIKKRTERKALWFCLSLLISVLTGILSNYIFNWLVH